MTCHRDSGVDLDGLARAAAGGDRRSTNDLLAALRPRVIRYCRGRVGNNVTASASADDVAQDVLLAVLTSLPRYRDQGRGFAAFVFGIAANKVADFYRKAGHGRTTPMADLPDGAHAEPGPEQVALRAEERRKLAQLLDVLSDSQRDVLVCRVVVGLSADETADLLSTTPGAVRVAQHRALTKLRGLLADRAEAA
ncbi:RNA polymerase sigma factor ShbA [Saccharothrix sp. NRRL B-16314]|uniref:RNA polymerase sigma factor ShbA n=1 Tax=Saccharothrix sp. NRRL B-16314 TaxID=1463825 RepID=UPI00068AED9D|nr:RNA polymerase sigma factor ShbA [Saccharothrix sp. NRRL B-16314]